MRSIPLYLFNDVFDNTVTAEQRHEFTWDELTDAFSTVHVSTTKNVAAFIAADFDTSPTAKRAEERVKHQDGSETFRVISINGQTFAGRLAENVTAVHAVVLDSDKDWTIEQAKQDLQGLRYLGYTSFNHLAPGKGERFRILLPFSTPCPVEEWNERKHNVEAMFPQVDSSTTNRARCFFVPCAHPTRRHLAQVWHQDGDALDWEVHFPRRPPSVKPSTPSTPRTALVKGGHGKIRWDTFDMVQFMRDRGLYIRHAGGSKHDVQCPNRQHHDGGTVIWQDGNDHPSFFCSHSKCKDFKFFQHFTPAERAPYCEREPEPITGASIKHRFLTRLLNKQEKSE